jgi:hypothetical protein
MCEPAPRPNTTGAKLPEGLPMNVMRRNDAATKRQVLVTQTFKKITVQLLQ